MNDTTVSTLPPVSLDTFFDTLEALDAAGTPKNLIMSPATYAEVLQAAGTEDPNLNDHEEPVGYRGRLLGADIIVSAYVPDGQILQMPDLPALLSPAFDGLTNAVQAFGNSMTNLSASLGGMASACAAVAPMAPQEAESEPPGPDPYSSITSIEMASGRAYDANGDYVLTLEPSGVAQFLRDRPDVELR